MGLKHHLLALIRERTSWLPKRRFQSWIPWIGTPFMVLVIVYLSATLGSAGSLLVESVDTQSKLIADYTPWGYIEIYLVRPEIVEEARLDHQRREIKLGAKPSTLISTPNTPSPHLPPVNTNPTSQDHEEVGSPPQPSSTSFLNPIQTQTLQPSSSQTLLPGQTQTATRTPPAPTSTLAATQTAAPSRTSQPETQAACSDLYFSKESGYPDGRVFFEVLNASAEFAQLQFASMQWNLENVPPGYLNTIRFQGKQVFEGVLYGPYLDSEQASSPLLSVDQIRINPGLTLRLELTFELEGADFDGTFRVDMTFELEGVGSCPITGQVDL